MKHTSHNWIAVKNKQQDVTRPSYLILQDKNSNALNIAVVIPCIGMDDAEVTANAKLIAAAPDLLEALKESFKRLKEIRDDHGQDSEITIQKADAAIKKATAEV